MQHLILLHGAIGTKEQLTPLENALQSDFKIHRVNFLGHDGKPIPDIAFSIQLFAEDVINYLCKYFLITVAGCIT